MSRSTSYTRGTLRPTDTSEMYPDCFGALQRVEVTNLRRGVKVVVRLVTSAIAAALAYALWYAYKELTK